MEITVKNLVQNYEGLHAVNDISLKIPSGKIFGIIGKSGAGKSTLLRMISLLERPESGEVYYDDKRVDNLAKSELIQSRRRLGMIFQNFNLFSSRSAIKNIAYPLEIAGMDKGYIKKRCEELLSIVGLKDKADSGISKLSGGQKQRIAIARALAASPEVLFCDEATSALDPGTTRQILSLIRDIQKQLGLTVVMVTHQMEVVRDACDIVAVLEDGKVVETGEVEKVFAHPESAVTRDFIINLKSQTSEKTENGNRLVEFSKGGRYLLRFPSSKTATPVISSITKSTGVSFNIFAAGVQVVKEYEFGTLLVDLIGTHEEIEEAIKTLKQDGVTIEEIYK